MRAVEMDSRAGPRDRRGDLRLHRTADREIAGNLVTMRRELPGELGAWNVLVRAVRRDRRGGGRQLARRTLREIERRRDGAGHVDPSLRQRGEIELASRQRAGDVLRVGIRLEIR